MNTKDRINANLDTVEKYIMEHGKEFGSVSWQMALLSLQFIREDFHDLDNTFDFDMEVD